MDFYRTSSDIKPSNEGYGVSPSLAGGPSGPDGFARTAQRGESEGGLVQNQGNADFANISTNIADRVMEAGVESPERLGEKLLSALAAGNMEEARELLDKHSDINVNIQGPEGGSPLIFAAAFGAGDIVDILLERDVEVDAQTSFGDTALIIAALNGSTSIVEALLSRGANMDIKGDGGDTALDCVRKQDPQNALMLDIFDAHIAAQKEAQEAAEVMAQAGRAGEQLIGFLERQDVDAAKGLLKSGAPVDVNVMGQMGVPPLFFALAMGDKALVETLIALGADVNAQTSEGDSALLLAVMQGDLGMVELLLSGASGQEVNLDVQDEYGKTPLMHAASGGNKDIAALLLRMGADPMVCDKDGDSAFVHALIGGDRAIVEALIDGVEDLNGRDRFGITALMHTVRRGDTVFANLLLERGANPDVQDNDGQTPLAQALLRGNKDLATLLIGKGADTNVRNALGFTPLMNAARGGQRDVVEFLLSSNAGVDVNMADNDGLTPLGVAVQRGDGKAVEILLAHEANPNIPDEHGKTPLMYAEYQGDRRMADALIQAGANPEAESVDGVTALAIRNARSNPDFEEVLDRAGRGHVGGKAVDELARICLCLPGGVEGLQALVGVLSGEELDNLRAAAGERTFVNTFAIGHGLPNTAQLYGELGSSFSAFLDSEAALRFQGADGRQGFGVDVVGNMYDSGVISGAACAGKLEEGSPFTISCDFPGGDGGGDHYVSLTFSGDGLVSINNRGAQVQGGGHVSFSGLRIVDVASLQEKGLLTPEFFEALMRGDVNTYRQVFEQPVVHMVPEQWQSVGNCGMANRKAGLLAQLVFSFADQVRQEQPDLSTQEVFQEAQKRAQEMYKEWSLYDRIERYKQYKEFPGKKADLEAFAAAKLHYLVQKRHGVDAVKRLVSEGVLPEKEVLFGQIMSHDWDSDEPWATGELNRPNKPDYILELAQDL